MCHLHATCAGVSGREDEWRTCITDTDSVLGFALGALFVKNAFHGESKEKVKCLCAGVVGAGVVCRCYVQVLCAGVVCWWCV